MLVYIIIWSIFTYRNFSKLRNVAIIRYKYVSSNFGRWIIFLLKILSKVICHGHILLMFRLWIQHALFKRLIIEDAMYVEILIAQ